MVTPVSMQQLVNAGVDCNTIATIATSTAETVIDRLGQTKLTMVGACARIGFEQPIPYSTSGQTLVRSNQTVSNAGVIYAPALNTVFPFTTSGAFDISKWRVLNTTDQDIIVKYIQVSSVITLRNYVPLFDGQLLSVSSYTTAGDKGGFRVRWNATKPAADDGITIFKAASLSVGAWEAEDLPACVNASRLGISTSNTSTTNSTRLDVAIPICLSAGVNTIHFTEVCTFSTSAESRQRSQINFSGKQPTGLYRKFAQKETKQHFIPQNDINPDEHLWKASNVVKPTVVLMGDSISTSGPDGYTANSDMWSVLCSEFYRKNPNKEFNFLNRSIGGQTWLNANTKPTAFPYSWYSNTSLDWLDVVKADAPDIIVLAFGMNDSNGFNAGAVNAVVSKINSWTKIPNIIFITNPTPALSTSLNDGFGFVAPAFQEGRDQAAGYVRSFAKIHGYGVIDINRAHTAMRDGYDIAKSALYANASIPATSYFGGAPVIDWGFLGTINGAANWPVGKVLVFKTGPVDTDQLFVVNEAGKFKVLGFSVDGATPTILTNVSIPSTSFELGVGVVDNVAMLVVNRETVATLRIVRQGGRYLPIIGWQGDLANGPFTDIIFSEGYPHTGSYQKSLTDEDIFGPSDSTGDRKMPYGGNGINHYSSQGVEKLVRPVFEVANLSIPNRSKNKNLGITLNAGVSSSAGVTAIVSRDMVKLSGLCGPSVNGVALFPLPLECTPSYDQRMVCAALAAPYTVLVKASADGNFYLEAGWTANQLDLSSISYNL